MSYLQGYTSWFHTTRERIQCLMFHLHSCLCQFSMSMQPSLKNFRYTVHFLYDGSWTLGIIVLSCYVMCKTFLLVHAFFNMHIFHSDSTTWAVDFCGATSHHNCLNLYLVQHIMYNPYSICWSSSSIHRFDFSTFLSWSIELTPWTIFLYSLPSTFVRR